MSLRCSYIFLRWPRRETCRRICAALSSLSGTSIQMPVSRQAPHSWPTAHPRTALRRQRGQLRANKIIPMEDARNSLLELSARLSNIKEKASLGTAVQQHRKRAAEHAATKGDLERDIRMVERKNAQIQAEVQRLAMVQGKTNGLYSKINGERLRLSKQFIDLESKNGSLETEIENTEERIVATDAEIRALNSPSCEALYYEIIKGLGVDFIENGGCTVARIRNKEKSDVFYVNIDSRPVDEACEEIWGCMGE